MSSNLAYSLPARSPGAEPQKPQRRVEIVSTRSQRRARPRPLYAVIAISGLFTLFVVQLLLSIVVSDGAYQISKLQSDQADLGRTEQSLNEQVDVLGSTQNLATKAEALGMVLSSATPAFLDISDGSVLGKSTSAGTTSTGVLDGAGSLVPNALIDGDTPAKTDSKKDAKNASSALHAIDPTKSGTTTTTPGKSTAGKTDKNATTGGAVDGATGTGSFLAGAPSGNGTGDSVASQNTLPSPVTR